MPVAGQVLALLAGRLGADVLRRRAGGGAEGGEGAGVGGERVHAVEGRDDAAPAALPLHRLARLRRAQGAAESHPLRAHRAQSAAGRGRTHGRTLQVRACHDVTHCVNMYMCVLLCGSVCTRFRRVVVYNLTLSHKLFDYYAMFMIR